METPEQIAETVKRLIAEVLAVDPAELRPQARFFQDLGGESIDVLDLDFQCEKRFGRKIGIQKILGDAIETDENGRVKPASLQAIRAKFPFLSFDGVCPEPGIEDLTQLLTVGAITQLVQFIVCPEIGRASCR